MNARETTQLLTRIARGEQSGLTSLIGLKFQGTFGHIVFAGQITTLKVVQPGPDGRVFINLEEDLQKPQLGLYQNGSEVTVNLTCRTGEDYTSTDFVIE